MRRNLKYLLIAGVLGLGLFTLGIPSAYAQVRFGVGVGVGPAYGGYYNNGGDPYYDSYDYGPYGPPPNCVYGYNPYSTYACAPVGYCGPDYFYDGVFVGVGPWFGRGFGPGFLGRFRDFNDFRRFGGFRGERFRDFANQGGLRGFRGGDAFRGGGGFRGGAPNGTFRGGAPNGAFRGGAPNGAFRGGAPHGAFRGGAPNGASRGGGSRGGSRGGRR